MPITSTDILSVGNPWPPTGEAPRLKAYADGRALLSGDHSDVFSDIVKLMRRDRRAGQMAFVQLGSPKRIVKAFNGLVFGEEPSIKAKGVGETGPAGEGSPAQEQLEAYIEAMDLLHEGQEALTDVQSLGDGVLKVSLKDMGVAGLYPDINATDPCIWYPVVSREDKQDVVAHILAWTWDEKIDRRTTRHLKAEVHEPGTVTTYLGTVKGAKIETLVEQGVLTTGVDECLVVPIFNFRSTADSTGIGDFVDLAPILQEITVRLYLIASILDKHSDPKLAGPRSLIIEDPKTGESVVVETDYIGLEPGQDAPVYVTWEGQLTAAWHEIDFLWEQALFVMEATRALFGDIEGVVTSGAALKRLLVAPLLKASILRGRMDIALKKALTLASLLHNTVDPSAVIFSDVAIEWQDGLPVDDMETMVIHSGYVAGGIESVEDAIHAVFDAEGEELAARMGRLPAKPALSPPSSPRITLSPLGDMKASEGVTL